MSTRTTRASIPGAALLALATLLGGCRASGDGEPREPVGKATATAASSVAIAPPPAAATSSPADARCDSPSTIALPAREPPATTTLVMLHGYGANAADIAPVARELASASPKMAVIVPDGCEPSGESPSGRQWWQLRGVPESERGAKIAAAGGRVLAFVNKAIEEHGFPRLVVWAGFSQGAMLAQWMAVHARPRPAAVVSFSGRFDDDSPLAAANSPLGTPVLLVHGTNDNRVPFAEAATSEARLKALGASVERVDRPGMGHSIDAESRRAAVDFLKRVLR